MPPQNTGTDQALVEKIEASIRSGKHFDAPLETDERALARVTDGIYRQPVRPARDDRERLRRGRDYRVDHHRCAPVRHREGE